MLKIKNDKKATIRLPSYHRPVYLVNIILLVLL